MTGFGKWLAATSLSKWIQDVDWVIPLLQSIHIITIGVVFVSSLMIALRVLGRMRADEPFAAVWTRFAPWMWAGLVVMLVTGLLLVVGEPVREFTALSFWMKMTLLAVAVIGTAVFGHTFGRAARGLRAVGDGVSAGVESMAGVGAGAGAVAGAGVGAGAHSEFSLGAKTVAAGLVVLWLAIIFLGRAIAYDVEVWGSLSLHT